jgi:hypothetical protein
VTWTPIASLRGPAGRDGIGDGHEQVFAAATDVWHVPHGLHTANLLVGVWDQSGVEILADVVQTDLDNLVVTFAFPMSGRVVVHRMHP